MTRSDARESTEFDLDVFDSFLDAVFVTDKTGLIKYANPIGEHIAETSIVRMVEKLSILEVFEFNPPMNLKDSLSHLAEGDSSSYQEYSFKTKKGTLGSLNIAHRQIHVGKQSYCLFVMRDISLEKILQEKFQRELQEKNVILKHEIAQRAQLQILNTELDRKVFHMTSLVDFDEATSLLSDVNQLLNEFIKFVITRFHFGGGFLVQKGTGHRIPQIDFITGYAERRVIHAKIDKIQKVLKGIQLEKIPAEAHIESKLGKEWKDLLEVVSGTSDHKQILTVKIRMGNDLAVTAFTHADEQKNLDEHDLILIRSLAQHAEVMIENAELKFLSLTDEMTKLYNKRYLTLSFKHEIQKSLNGEPLSVLVFDIDHFKKFNDTYGHLAGDLVLREVSDKVKQLCRLTDIPFRYGGEEFVVLLPGTSSENARIVAERIRTSVENLAVKYDGNPLHVTVSVGIATCPENGAEGEVLIKCADEALYEAKRGGRNNVKVYTKKN